MQRTERVEFIDDDDVNVSMLLSNDLKQKHKIEVNRDDHPIYLFSCKSDVSPSIQLVYPPHPAPASPHHHRFRRGKSRLHIPQLL